MKSKQWLFIMMTGMCLFINHGCALLLIGGGAAAGAGTVAYIKGELRTTQEISFERAWNATIGALKELGFAITQDEKDTLSGMIVARGADDQKIIIHLKKESEKLTEIRIRVGAFGDEARSQLILDNIKAKA
jgi:hypothetical protein